MWNRLVSKVTAASMLCMQLLLCLIEDQIVFFSCAVLCRSRLKGLALAVMLLCRLQHITCKLSSASPQKYVDDNAMRSMLGLRLMTRFSQGHAACDAGSGAHLPIGCG